MNKPRILVIEDDRAVSSLITTTLETQGYLYTVAGLGTFAACPDTTIRDERLISVIRDRIRSDLKELFYLGMSQEEVSALLKELLSERGGWK